MNASTIKFQYTLLIFIYNMRLILNNTDGNLHVVSSTKTYLLKNVSLSNHKSGSFKTGINADTNVLQPSVDVELNIDLIKDKVTRNKNEIVDVLGQESGVSEIIENNISSSISFLGSSSVEFEKFDEMSAMVSKDDEDHIKEIVDYDKGMMENVSAYNVGDEDVLITEVTLSGPQINSTEGRNEDIPSFSEWAQRHLEEAEKREQVNSSFKVQGTNGKGKLRWKNYASLDCGAKVIAANPESVSPGAILSPSSDEYKLNPCTSRIWFIVELCETIQTKKIDLANYELFSSSPKDFIVSISDRYPTRDWSIIGMFTAKDERDVQSFDLETNIFGKYIKVEIKSHYGSEHYCPISLFRAYGTSVFEVLQKEDPGNIHRIEDDGDENDESISSTGDLDDNVDSITTIAEEENDNSPKNLFTSATDAVISIVKRAAEVLGNKVENQTIKEINEHNYSRMNTCNTPNYIIYCKNCDDTLFKQIYELISCKVLYIKQLIGISFLYKALSNSVVCLNYDYEYKVTSNLSNNLLTEYVISLFPSKYLGAMCNEISVLENRGILNNSNEISNTTRNITNAKAITMKLQIGDSDITKLEKVKDSRYFETITNSSVETNNFEDITYISRIKPTRPFIVDTGVHQTNINLNVTTSAMVNRTVEASTIKLVDTFSSEKKNEHSTELITDIESISEGIDVFDHIEHFISEFNTDYSQNPIPSNTATTTNSPQAQKESIFLRLSNRIKALERNMSLSSQYLEELSKRYKKQVEEIQSLLEKTVLSLQEDGFKKDLRNKQLEDRLDNLTAIIESLVIERHNWFLTMYWSIFSVLFILVIYFFCGKYYFIKSSPGNKEATEIFCGKPTNPLIQSFLRKKNRRPSDQALKILHYSAVKSTGENMFNQRQKKRKKKHTLKKSNSIGNIKDQKCSARLESKMKNGPDWIEQNHQIIEATPYVLDESEHSALETNSLANELMDAESIDHMSSVCNIKMSATHPYEYETTEDFSVNECLSNKTQSKSNIDFPKKEKRSFKKLLKKVF